MAKKLTLNEVIDRCNEIFDNKYDYTQSVFVNTRTPMDIICPIHGKFSIPPKRHLRGQGCPECGKEYARNWRKGEWQHFVERLEELYPNQFDTPNIENLYENEKSIVELVCKNCGCHYNLMANYFLSDKFKGCKECKFYYTFEELNDKNATDNEMVYFEGKKDYRTDKVKLICEEHGEYDVSVSTILQGKGKCIKCNGHSRLLTQEEVFKRLKEKYGDSIIPLTPYVKSDIPMKFRCSNGHTFDRDFNTAMCGDLFLPCPICSKIELSKRRTKTLEQFIEDAIKVYGKDKYDFSESKYISSSDAIIIKCNDCGRYFTLSAGSFLQGHGCPYHNCNSSLMEKDLANVIKSYGYECLTNSRNILLNNKEIDIFIPQLKIAFEFDGLYWHNEINKESNYHLNKTIECEKKGIKLFHIFEDEWANKRNIIISKLNEIFHKNQEFIRHGDCNIRIINNDEAYDFLNNNHIKGGRKCDINYGLIYNNEIVSIMSFVLIGENKQYELIRYCNKLNTNIVDGDTTLFNFALFELNPSEIIYYSDRRFPQNEFIHKLGFETVSKTTPNYFYVIGNKRVNKSFLTKQTLVKKYNCPPTMSKETFCKTQKWYKIYDCGYVHYVWLNKQF
jgi:hypothetical protein